MRRRIFVNTILLTTASLIIVSAALCCAFYAQFSHNVMDELRNRAETFLDNDSQTAIEVLAITKSADMRVTLIMPDGTVAFDNMAQAELMPNHLDRQEVRDALATGAGRGTRYSDTLGKDTAYYAVRLTDGYVLRVAKTSSGIMGVFLESLPVVAVIVLAVIIAGYLLAGRLTKRIVAPINAVNLEAGAAPPYDELAPFISTIERQRARIERQLADLKSRADTISAITGNMNEGIILIDKHGVILSANKSVLGIFEKEAPLDGKNILAFIRDVNFSAHVRGALDGASGEMGMERAGRAYRVYFSHVSDGGAIILFLDITEKAKAEKLRREFSANVSHELKTPLTSIYGNAEMLCSGMVKESDRHAFYGRIKDEAARLIALIEDILMLSRLDEGGGRQALEEVELAAVAAEAAEALAQKAAENAVAVRVSGYGVAMWANRALMYDMFYNLTDNAIKYNKPGGRVDICIAREGEEIGVTVADTGIGIPKDAQSRLFERFYRVDKSRSKKTGGTGLGLAIVKHIVSAHGGHIELKSRLDAGTTVRLTFAAGDSAYK